MLRLLYDPNSVTAIGLGAFYGCTRLTSVTIPDGVSRIGWGEFHGCGGLTNVIIDRGMTNIGEMAFDGCTSLTGVFFEGNAFCVGPFISYAFGGSTNATVAKSDTSKHGEDP